MGKPPPRAASSKQKRVAAPRKSRKVSPTVLLERSQRLLSRGGNVRVALKHLEAARNALRKTDTILRPQILYWLAQTYMIADDVEAMEGAAQDLITIGHTRHTPEVEADGYLLFAKAQYIADRPLVALTSLDCAEALYREAKHDLGLAHTLRNRGDALYRLGRHELALTAYAAAEEIYLREDEVGGLGNTLAARGDLLFFLGRNDEALFFLNQAQTFLVVSGNDHAIGGCLQKLGALHSFVGRTREALRAYNRACRIFRSIGDEGSLADTVFRRGELYFRIGQNDHARRDLYDAVKRHERTGDIHGRASALNALAEVLLQMGLFEHCLDLASQAETLFIEINDPMGRGYAVQNLAWAAYQLGRDDEALRRSNEGVLLARERNDQLGEANALATCARILARFEREDEALNIYFEAAALYKIIGDLVGLSDMQSSSARIFRRRGDYPAALTACDEAKRLSEEASEPLGAANASATRGQILFAMGRIDEGHEALMEARRAYESIEARWNIPQLDMERARLLSAAGRFDAARLAALDSLAGVDALREFGPSAQTHTDLIEQFADALVVLLDVLRRLERFDEIVIAMESRRAWTLRWLATQEAPSSRTQRSKTTPAKSSHASGHLPARALKTIDLPTVTDRLQAATSEGAVVLAWYPLPADDDQRVGCLLGVPGHAPKYVEIEMEHSRLAAATLKTLELGHAQEETGWDDPLAELETIVLSGKIKSEYTLNGIRISSSAISLRSILQTLPSAPLAIVPQGLFGLIPWAALLTPDKHHLVEERPTYLLPQFMETRGVNPRRSPTSRPRAFCFGLGSTRLHWTEREATEVAAVLSSHNYQVTTQIGREENSISRFVETAKNCNILHLATHAEFNAGDPFQSFLDFGGATSSPERLRLVDLLALDLAGSTAVLSACSTAVTDWKRVFDPVSLLSAFLAAGCAQVIGTMWEVDDSSTMLLMQELYHLVLDEHLAWDEALRLVQISALHGSIQPRESVSGSSVRGLFSGARISSRRRGLVSPLRWGAFSIARTLP